VSGDTSELIFTRRFLVSVPQIDLVTEDEIKMYGTLITGDPSVDRMMATQMTRTYLPIATMAGLFDRGSRVSIINRDDVKIIYDYITQHIQAWSHVMTTSIHSKIAPVDDLAKLDNFAQAIFKDLRHDIKDTPIFESDLLRRLQKLSTPGLSKVTQIEEKDLPERSSFNELMKDLNIKKGRNRWS